MIFNALDFLKAELNAYIDQKMSVGASAQERLILGNIARADHPANTTTPLDGRAILSLVNMEEDRAARNPENFIKIGATVVHKQPPLLLNLYVLLSVNRDDYKESLILLGHIVQFFQFQRTFTPLTHPRLDTRIGKLSVELYTMTFEQMNHLWSVLGGKYLPSALYKVRQVVLDENAVVGETGVITELDIDATGKQPTS
jgi:hypothetical protein